MPEYETYKPTAEDVLTALTRMPILKGELIREIANRQGLPERGGYMPQVINTYVLDKILTSLVKSREVMVIKGDHWAVGGSGRVKQTFYLAASSKAKIAERADKQENDRIRDQAEVQALAIIVDRHRKEMHEERDIIIAAVTPPDHVLLWEE